MSDWWEERAGLPSLWRRIADEPLPGGARLAYVFGSTLAALLLLQLLTGLGLALWYSPSEQAAWASVWFVEERVWGGRLLRGLHHHGASVAVAVAALHMAQTFAAGAHRRPRELTWMVGVVLLLLLLGFSLTGTLLPWDQRGRAATQVATAIAGTAPLVGPALERVALGGEGYGTATLTRFYALHAVALPLLLLALATVHLVLFRRRGVTPPAAVAEALQAGAPLPEGRFWPDQAARDGLAALLAVALVALLAWRQGAPLEAPADPALAPVPRPEWYLLGVFQLLKVVPGPLEKLATLGLPALAVAFLLALPFLDRAPGRRLRERGAVAVIAGGLALGYAFLTAAAIAADTRDPQVAAARAEAARLSARARALAGQGVPPEGAGALLAHDPVERGRRLFAGACLRCHTVGGEPTPERPRAPDLAGLFSPAFIAEQIRDPDQPGRFGRTRLRKAMDAYGRRLPPERIALLARWLHARREPAAAAAPEHAEARALFRRAGCADCHEPAPDEKRQAPDLAGYGSDRYLATLLEWPDSPEHFGALSEMPPLRERASPEDLAALAAYLRTLEPLPPWRPPEPGSR